MTEQQQSMIKLALAAKGVPGPLADLVVENLNDVQGAVRAFTQAQQASAMIQYVNAATVLMEIPGYAPLADRLLEAVGVMLGVADDGVDDKDDAA